MQDDLLRVGMIFQKLLHDAGRGTAERIDRLVIIPDGKQIAFSGRKQFYDLILQAADVLEFIDQKKREAIPIQQKFCCALEKRCKRLINLHKI